MRSEIRQLHNAPTSSRGVAWKALPSTIFDNGHRFEGAYVGELLADVRCAHCFRRPIELLTTDRMIERCHGRMARPTHA